MESMRPFILISLALISTVSFGQDSRKPTNASFEFKRFMLGVNISPDYCFRVLENNNGSATSDMVIDLRNENEVAKLGFTGGLNICFNLSKRLGIETGLQYSSKGYAFKNSELTFGDLIDPRYGFLYTNNGGPAPVLAKFIYHDNYLDIPLRVIYSFGEKKLHCIASIGVTANIFLHATQTSILEFEDGSERKETRAQDDDFKSMNISPAISAGIDYGVSQQFNLRVEPTFRYGLLNIIDTPVTAYLWNAGLNVTCYYKFN